MMCIDSYHTMYDRAIDGPLARARVVAGMLLRTGGPMQRVTITIDEELVAGIDRFVDACGYQGRSEAIRDLARSGLALAGEQRGLAGDCVSTLVYVSEHASRDLAKRLARLLHDHHDLAVSSLQVPLDHDASLSVLVLRGSASEVRHLAEHVIAERGVLYGRLVMTPARIEQEVHDHGGTKPRRHVHTHVSRAL
jgi:CopG family nickel-responsive transcriptional regulator